MGRCLGPNLSAIAGENYLDLNVSIYIYILGSRETGVVEHSRSASTNSSGPSIYIYIYAKRSNSELLQLSEAMGRRGDGPTSADLGHSESRSSGCAALRKITTT